MKIKLEKHNPNWANDFEDLKRNLIQSIAYLKPQIEHIGSTSVKGLSAKPIIDILVGVNNEDDLDKVIIPLTDNGYVYYEIYNVQMPYRRFFIKHKTTPESLSIPPIITREKDAPNSTEEHDQRLAHIHILPYNSEHWIRHIAFRDYLEFHPEVRDAYQQLKLSLSQKEWLDGNEYNLAKDQFIKTEERKAIEWAANKQIR
ncbi:GrpB family protein [Fluviicola sp.]|uniref:GrpB family protein n=1 Tax=Fluviicola sp. TaxID=1917219 RepID=UPI0026240285|nr:GrpB family protein [Fluviicola sp.]